MVSFLLQIVNDKKQEVKILYDSDKARRYEHEARSKLGDHKFLQVLVNGRKKLIAEFKRASPSKGYIRKDASALEISYIYERAGASAISVITDKHFSGSLEDLEAIRKNVEIPILRKDFIIDRAQIYESRVYGADAILLIASLLTENMIEEFSFTAESLGMDVIVECHNKEDIEKAIKAKTKIIGINARDLRDFSVNSELFEKLIPFVSQEMIVVVESGIKTREDIDKLSDRVNAILVGEALMSQKFNINLEDIENKVSEFVGY